jgi:outer membrane PBP1 activator LpoA protein
MDMIKIPNNTVTKPLHILNTNLNDFVFLIAVPTHISPIKPAITPANTKLL